MTDYSELILSHSRFCVQTLPHGEIDFASPRTQNDAFQAKFLLQGLWRSIVKLGSEAPHEKREKQWGKDKEMCLLLCMLPSVYAYLCRRTLAYLCSNGFSCLLFVYRYILILENVDEEKKSPGIGHFKSLYNCLNESFSISTQYSDLY